MLRKVFAAFLLFLFIFIFSGCTPSSSSSSILVLEYHGVVPDNAWGKVNHLYNIRVETFENQIKTLLNAGYKPISAEKLIDFYYNGYKPSGKEFLITFDDGYRNNYLYAFPILKKYRIPAEINLIVARIDQAKNHNDPIKGYLNWAEVREMAKSGLIYFGSHTYDSHNKVITGKNKKKNYPFLGPIYLANQKRMETWQEAEKRVNKDLMLSVEHISYETGIRPEIFCYPHGNYNTWFISRLKENGFKIALAGNIPQNNNPFTVKRILVTDSLRGKILLMKLNLVKYSNILDFIIKKASGSAQKPDFSKT
ncbi:polysaccharide deacetylase family protein [Carboxydothermus hydrogenoformans]|uniref:Polysaccharide deacetylase family protein n=1 Tax=Carboxydothermus hydrogenoformans (strain ATCC BAA-161 / DSM 6008 / Z-2901) TaxID=246194 RepID=Q3AB13_CARHZ|nr:polysaccharide deacetylase family protein [Carboxydothermus hydrogenoformans]ABB14705.1 polysaccharide deacetylase family protein [Carboxydothermus hydrogenoformans Z-2901]